MVVAYITAHGENRYFYKKDDVWYFSIDNASRIRVAYGASNKITMIDPPRGPLITRKTNLNNIHRLLPDKVVKGITWCDDEQAFKLDVR